VDVILKGASRQLLSVTSGLAFHWDSAPNAILELRRLEMNRRSAARLTFVCLLLVAALAVGADAGKPISVKGYVLDSACAFTKNLKKPISAECAVACAKAGSPLVILADNGTIYWPIADTTPSSGQNEMLLPFAGQKVTASGRVFQRGGSSALVIEKIEPLSDHK
jgi:hypothetical protein